MEESVAVVNHHLLLGYVRSTLATYVHRKRSKLHSHLNQIRNRAFDKGYRQGQLTAQTKNSMELLEGAKHSTEFIKTLRKEALEAACIIASKIIEKEIKRTGEMLARSIRKELDALIGNQTALVRVHPQDYQEIYDLLTPSPFCRWETSTEIDRGIAQVITTNGSLYIDWREKLSAFMTTLTEKLSQETEPR